MANVDRPNGLTPIRHLNGSPWNGALTKCFIPATDSTAVFKGDAVVSAGSADADGVPTVARASAGSNLRGVVVAFEPVGGDLELLYRPASTAMYAYVCDDPDVVFMIQEDSVGGALGAANVGNNADLVVGAGDTSSGASNMELDSSDAIANTTAAAQLRILGLHKTPDNEIGTNAKWEVLINEHEFKSTTGV